MNIDGGVIEIKEINFNSYGVQGNPFSDIINKIASKKEEMIKAGFRYYGYDEKYVIQNRDKFSVIFDNDFNEFYYYDDILLFSIVTETSEDGLKTEISLRFNIKGIAPVKEMN